LIEGSARPRYVTGSEARDERWRSGNAHADDELRLVAEASGPSPSGQLSARTAALAGSRRSGSMGAAVTPARTAHADAKSSKANSMISESTRASTPASASWARHRLGSAMAPGPTPSMRGLVAWARSCRHLLQPDDVRAIRPRPDRRHQASARFQHPCDLARGGGAIDHVHQTERSQNGILARPVRGIASARTIGKGEIGESGPGGPLAGQRQHFGADVHADHMAIRRDARRADQRHRSGACAEVENVLPGPEIGMPQLENRPPVIRLQL